MITVTIGESKTQEVKPFPKLMRNEHGAITFFIEKNVGVVIVSAENEGKIKFCDRFRMEGYVDFNSPITIQNK